METSFVLIRVLWKWEMGTISTQDLVQAASWCHFFHFHEYGRKCFRSHRSSITKIFPKFLPLHMLHHFFHAPKIGWCWLKKMSQIGGIFPNFRGEHKTWFKTKPPPSFHQPLAISYKHANPWQKENLQKKMWFQAHCAICFSQHHRKPNPIANLIQFELPFNEHRVQKWWFPPLMSPPLRNTALMIRAYWPPAINPSSQVAFQLQIIKVQGAMFLRIYTQLRGVLAFWCGGYLVVFSQKIAIASMGLVYLHVPYKST